MKRKSLTAAIVVAVIAGMTGLAFAAVPLYEAFCRATGYGGTTPVADAAPAPGRVLDRRMEVRFDANTAPDLPVTFAPKQRAQTLRIGESGVAFYRIHNLSDRAIVAHANYNVTPQVAGSYFFKTECFCFNDRTLAPGEEADLPLIYFISPDIVDDPDTRELATLTLSYTFFRAADQSAAAASN